MLWQVLKHCIASFVVSNHPRPIECFAVPAWWIVHPQTVRERRQVVMRPADHDGLAVESRVGEHMAGEQRIIFGSEWHAKDLAKSARRGTQRLYAAPASMQSRSRGKKHKGSSIGRERRGIGEKSGRGAGALE